MSRKQLCMAVPSLLGGLLCVQEYAVRRGDPSEAAYNMGRAAHQLGLHSLAASLYHTALQPATDASAGRVSWPKQLHCLQCRRCACVRQRLFLPVDILDGGDDIQAHLPRPSSMWSRAAKMHHIGLSCSKAMQGCKKKSVISSDEYHHQCLRDHWSQWISSRPCKCRSRPSCTCTGSVYRGTCHAMADSHQAMSSNFKTLRVSHLEFEHDSSGILPLCGRWQCLIGWWDSIAEQKCNQH